jgi:CHAD domain-containing protein
MELSINGVLKHQLDKARRQILRVQRAQNGGALHDFRLSIRRMCVWLKTCRDEGVANIPDRTRRQLKTLVDLTNLSRDLDVHLELLQKYSRKLALEKNSRVEKLKEKWTHERNLTLKKALRKAIKLFGKLDPTLTDLLAEIEKRENTQDLKVSVFVQRPMFKVALELDEVMRHIKSIDEQKNCHRARLYAKALRYLAEPLVPENAKYQLLLDRLKHVQDVIGNLRDSQILALRLQKKSGHAAVRSILDRNQAQAEVFFGQLAATYLKSPSSSFESQLQLLASIPEQP